MDASGRIKKIGPDDANTQSLCDGGSLSAILASIGSPARKCIISNIW